MTRMLKALVALGVVGLAIFWFVTAPQKVGKDEVIELSRAVPDISQGAAVFTAAGCASCHAAPKAEGTERLILSGGRAFVSDFGTFYAPNISSDPTTGIGGWSATKFANAVRYGTTPQGSHYFPAFPYGSYANATLSDVVSLHAYLATLPASNIPSQPHDVGFPFNIRRTLGGWKILFLPKGWVFKDAATPQLERGRYLVEALGHCGECHTPRNLLGGLKTGKWLSGAPNPSGKGTIPNITPGKLDWSEADLLFYFTAGFKPDFNTAAGEMVEVIENLSQMPESDLQAIVAYLKAVPAIK